MSVEFFKRSEQINTFVFVFNL